MMTALCNATVCPEKKVI